MFDFLPTDAIGEFISTFLVAMLPIVELRGAIPAGVALDLSPTAAFVAAVLGNMVPVPFIILLVRRIFAWLKQRGGKLGQVVCKLETRAHNKSAVVIKYRAIGLCLLVAVPLPGTGAWTGALVAALLDMPLRSALPTILLGVIIAGLIVLGLTMGVIAIF